MIYKYSTLFFMMLLSMVVTSTSHAVQSPEQIITHGAACQPANLGQSLNFGTNWNQIGVRNRNALGSGRFFFVVCPTAITDDQTVAAGSDVNIQLVYQDRDDVIANRVSCTGYRYKDGLLVRTVTVADTDPATGPGTAVLALNDLVRDSDTDFRGLSNDTVSVVCALPPQATINAVQLDHD